MTEELKPCPFCGNTAWSVNSNQQWKFVHCSSCHIDGPADLGLSGANAVWNTRPAEDALNARIAELETVVAFYANPDIYHDDNEGGDSIPEDNISTIVQDGGDIARRALEQKP